MKIEIRSAVMADALLIATLNADVQGVHARGVPDMFKAPLIDANIVREFEADIADATHFFFVAEVDGLPVGYLFAVLQRRSESSRHYKTDMIYVNHLSVKPENRRQGVGRALLDAAKDFGRRRSINRMALDVWRFNEDARRFFVGYGLEVYNERMWMAYD
jgi:GNAT superfamily N-acetyltransferase